MTALVHPFKFFAMVRSIRLIDLPTSPAPVFVTSSASHMQAAYGFLSDYSARRAGLNSFTTFRYKFPELRLYSFLAINIGMPFFSAAKAHISHTVLAFGWS